MKAYFIVLSFLLEKMVHSKNLSSSSVGEMAAKCSWRRRDMRAFAEDMTLKLGLK